MTFKTLLVHVDNGRRCAARVDVALQLASDFDAHLIGLYVTDLPDISSYSEGDSVLHIQKPAREEAEADAVKAAESFQDRVQRAGLTGAEWRRVEGELENAIGLHARYADLVILGQPDLDDKHPYVPVDFPALLALAVARPVLVVPYTGTFTHVGRNVLVGWNGSREAARAVADALPLLKRAEKVMVMAVSPGRGPMEHGEVPGADLALYLARHGVNAEVTCDDRVETDVGEWLLSRAADLTADLIVMGAYGHRRLREWVLGGVTRTLVRKMTVPVLMSH